MNQGDNNRNRPMGVLVLCWCMHVVTATRILGSALPHPNRTTSMCSMIGKFVKGKTSVFIDAANIFYSEQTLGWRIDYERLADYLRRELSLTGLYYYTDIIEKNENQRAFLKKLESFGYAVTAKEVKFIRLSGGSFTSKGSLDIEFALDAYIRRDQ